MRGDRGEVLGNALLSVGIVLAAELGINRRCLIGVHALAAAECHVLLRVRHAREPRRGFIGADEVVFLDGDNRGQPVANNDDAHPVVQRGTGDVGLAGSGKCGSSESGKQKEQKSEARTS